MRVRLTNLWDTLNNSFWFIPGMTVLLSLFWALLLPYINFRYTTWFEERLYWLVITPGTAQAILSTIAGTMVTVLSVVFSITLVALSIASSQLGPRLMRTFTSNLTTQLTMGLLIGTSMYSLLVLGSVRDLEDAKFIPHLAVAFSIVMAFVSLLALIYFIHSIVMLIQVPNLVHRVSQELNAAIDHLYPERRDEDDEENQHETQLKEKFRELGEPSGELLSSSEGYIQGIEFIRLVECARELDLVFDILKFPGQFVSPEVPLLRYWGNPRDREALEREANEIYLLGNRPTPRQDVECAVDELVEVAVRALSAGINDPQTAINCIDRLSASLSRLARRKIPSPFQCDQDGALRVISPPVSFPHVLERSFDLIRQNGHHQMPVLVRILQALTAIALQARRREDLEAIRTQGDNVMSYASEKWSEGPDIARLRDEFTKLRDALHEQEEESRNDGLAKGPREEAG